MSHTCLGTHQSMAMWMGVVRHEVKTSAGSSGFCGSSSPALQAASLTKKKSGKSVPQYIY
jgi:hypothetical protein